MSVHTLTLTPVFETVRKQLDRAILRSDVDRVFSHSDGWGNVQTGLGIVGKDKRKGGVWWPDFVPYTIAQNIWRASSLADRMVSVWPNEMLREGWCLSSADPDLNERVEDRAAVLGLDPALIDGMCYQRAYGGGAVLLGVNDGQDLSEPLNEDTIVSFDFLTVLASSEITPYAVYGDPTLPKYGETMLYQIGLSAPGMVTGRVQANPVRVVHESRLLVFDGIRTARNQVGVDLWGDSIFVRAKQALEDFEAACAAVGILVTDFAPNVFKMKNLLAVLAAEGSETDAAIKGFTTRMQAIAMGKSVANTALVDAEDEYKRETVNVAGLAELWDRLTIALAAIADMPVTLLMGQSPKGLGNEGESDIRFFYDRVKAKQGKMLRPIIERVVRLIIKAERLKDTETWKVTFHPLYQATAKEQAETRAAQATADFGYLDRGVYTPSEIRKSRGDGNTLTTHVDPDEDIEATAEDKQALAAGAAAVSGASPAGANVQTTAFNGTQIEAAKGIAIDAFSGRLPRDAAIAMLTIMFPITAEQAAKMVPAGFKIAEPDPAPTGGSPFGAKP